MPKLPHVYSYTVFYALSFTYVPIIIVLFTNRGITMSQVGFLLSLYYLIFLIVELPTGVIADKLGRKVTMVAGCLFQAMALGVLFISHSFHAFILVEMLFGFSRSLMSGADSAFVYDSLAVQNASQHYKSVTSRLHATDLISHTVGGLLSAGLAYYSLNLVVIFGLTMALIAAIFTTLLSEPERPANQPRQSVSTYVKHLVSSCREVMTTPKLLWLMYYSMFIFILLRSSLISLAQPLLISLNVPVHYFGLIDAILSFGSALLTLNVNRIESAIGFKRTLWLMPLVMLISFFGIASTMSIWSIGFYLFAMVTWALQIPVMRDLINHTIVSSEKRATMLSVESLMSRVGFSVVAMGLGVILDHLGVQSAMLTMAIITMIGTTLLSITGRRVLTLAPLPKCKDPSDTSSGA